MQRQAGLPQRAERIVMLPGSAASICAICEASWRRRSSSGGAVGLGGLVGAGWVIAAFSVTFEIVIFSRVGVTQKPLLQYNTVEWVWWIAKGGNERWPTSTGALTASSCS